MMTCLWKKALHWVSGVREVSESGSGGMGFKFRLRF